MYTHTHTYKHHTVVVDAQRRQDRRHLANQLGAGREGREGGVGVGAAACGEWRGGVGGGVVAAVEEGEVGLWCWCMNIYVYNVCMSM